MNNNDKLQFLSTREAIIKWLDEYCIKNYIINDDLSVDVNGSVDISHHNLNIIPVKFGMVTGNFWCNNNRLISLVGSPKSVGGSFYCFNNQLINLLGSPETVNGSFWCYKNDLTSLLEVINCHFNREIIFNICEKNFKQKEIIQVLEKYYIPRFKYFQLTKDEFHDKIKPVLYKRILQKKLYRTPNNIINIKTKNIFL